MRIAIKAPAASAPDAAGQDAALPLGGLGFDWAMMLLSSVFLGGLYLDGWAHNHDKVDVSFFTVWHAFFYSGFLLVALLLVTALLLNHRLGLPWREALPGGYQLSLLGTLVFAAGGVGDLLWHELFGIEKSVDALYSPSHLTLGLGLGLIVSGPLRAAWQRPGRRLTWLQAAPALLSLAALISTFTFFVMFSHPLAVNIAVKSGLALLYWRSYRVTQSPALQASFTDSRNDILASAGALIGLHFGGRADSLAGLAIGVFIAVQGWLLGMANLRYVMGGAPSPETLADIARTARQVEGVVGVHDVRAHYVGDVLHVELHIEVPRHLSVEQAHAIAVAVSQALERSRHIDRAFVHVDPS